MPDQVYLFAKLAKSTRSWENHFSTFMHDWKFIIPQKTAIGFNKKKKIIILAPKQKLAITKENPLSPLIEKRKRNWRSENGRFYRKGLKRDFPKWFETSRQYHTVASRFSIGIIYNWPSYYTHNAHTLYIYIYRDEYVETVSAKAGRDSTLPSSSRPRYPSLHPSALS